MWQKKKTVTLCFFSWNITKKLALCLSNHSTKKPPKMTEKECEHHHDEDEKMRRRIGAAVLSLLAAGLFVVFLVWAILHPHGPRFVLQDATIYAFNISEPNFLTSNLQVTLSSRNPNDIGIFYDRLDIYASYRNQQVCWII